MAHNALINGTNYSIKGGNSLINGTGYKVSGGGVLINGTRQNIAFGTPLNNLSVGSSVYMNVSGVRTEFLIVHKGIPDSNDQPPRTKYDISCDGIWLLMKCVYEDKQYGANSGNYANSDMHNYLNTTFISRFDLSIQNIMKQVKIPYYICDDTGFYQKLLSNGVPTKLFLLDSTELRISNQTTALGNGGSILEYFLPASLDGSSELRVTTYINNTNKASYWTRSPALNQYNEINAVYWYGAGVSINYTAYVGIRPACIMPYSTLIDSNMNIIA